VNIIFFSSFWALAWLRPLERRRRTEAAVIGAAGIVLSVFPHWVKSVVPPNGVLALQDWLPVLLMLMVYWQVGRFSQAPCEKLQRFLLKLDQRVLGSLLRSRANPWKHPWIMSYLEFVYLLCYPLVPLGIVILYLANKQSCAGKYWEIVLPSTYLCYVLMPFVQTLPPRMISTDPYEGPALGSIRRLNLRILHQASIQVNTFPSAHVAATMASSLALIRFAPTAGLVFLWVSLSIAVSVAVCRYHYAADSLLAILLAAGIFLLQTHWAC
jgi:hypothetical protein